MKKIAALVLFLTILVVGASVVIANMKRDKPLTKLEYASYLASAECIHIDYCEDLTGSDSALTQCARSVIHTLSHGNQEKWAIASSGMTKEVTNKCADAIMNTQCREKGQNVVNVGSFCAGPLVTQ